MRGRSIPPSMPQSKLPALLIGIQSLNKMDFSALLNRAIEGGSFTIASARELSRHAWRSTIRVLDADLRNEMESLFYFIEGFVEEVDEGFVEASNDKELYERILAILPRLQSAVNYDYL